MKKSLRYLIAGLVLIVALFSVGCVADLGPELLGTTWTATPVAGTTISIVIGTQNEHVGFLIGHLNVYDAVINYSDGTNNYTWEIALDTSAQALANAEAIRTNLRAATDTPLFTMTSLFGSNIIAAYGAADISTLTPPIVLAGSYESGTGMTLDVYLDNAQEATFTGVLFTK